MFELLCYYDHLHDCLYEKGEECLVHMVDPGWLDPKCTTPCPIRLDNVAEKDQVKLVPHSEIQMLGVPLGSDVFVSKFVEDDLIEKLTNTVAKLVAFEDSQAAAYLLRVSYSIVRMRTTPLRQGGNRALSSTTWRARWAATS